MERGCAVSDRRCPNCGKLLSSADISPEDGEAFNAGVGTICNECSKEITSLDNYMRFGTASGTSIPADSIHEDEDLMPKNIECVEAVEANYEGALDPDDQFG